MKVIAFFATRANALHNNTARLLSVYPVRLNSAGIHSLAIGPSGASHDMGFVSANASNLA